MCSSVGESSLEKHSEMLQQTDNSRVPTHGLYSNLKLPSAQVILFYPNQNLGWHSGFLASGKVNSSLDLALRANFLGGFVEKHFTH